MHTVDDTESPIPFAIACAAGQFLLTILILKFGFSFAPPEAYGKVKLLAFASTIVYPLVLAHAFGLWKRLALGLDRIRPQPVFLAGLAAAALFLPWGLRSADGGKLASDFTLQFFNAFGEELLFRGVIFALLLSLPAWRGIVLNGLLFGAVRYRSGSLWLCVILHMALNLCMIYSKVQGAAESTVFLVERAANLIEIAVAAWVIFGARRTSAAPAAA